MNRLAGKNILIGVTGSIAAYKCVEIVRLLKKEMAEVRVIITEAGQQFITPLTLQAISGNIVRTKMFDAIEECSIEHISLARWADLVLIAPATAGIASRLCYATASDLLSTVCLATEAQLILAPAMNHIMWNNWAVKNTFKQLLNNGIKIIGPVQGDLACGEVGMGKMTEPVDIVNEIIKIFSSDS